MLHVCSPIHKDHDDLTLAPSSADFFNILSEVFLINKFKNLFFLKNKGFARSIKLLIHSTTRADDNHAVLSNYPTYF
jgi:hypothetical protein